MPSEPSGDTDKRHDVDQMTSFWGLQVLQRLCAPMRLVISSTTFVIKSTILVISSTSRPELVTYPQLGNRHLIHIRKVDVATFTSARHLIHIGSARHPPRLVV
jgi:hypothetical protein